jgi:hypothetical protein
MVGMAYKPDTERAKSLGRPYDILHDNARFYETTYSELAIERNERESEHGNLTPAESERYHYHHGLRAGDATTAANLVRVLLRSVAEHGRYDQDAFVAAMIDFMTTPGANRDPYCEIFLRRWFENYAAGKDPLDCAEHQRNVWSIGSHGGVIRPLVVSLLARSAYQGAGLGLTHQIITHRSENVASAVWVLAPLLHGLLAGRDPLETIDEYGRLVHPPKVSGEELFRMYRDHDGPGNIPDDEMWRLHTELAEEPLDLAGLAASTDESEVVRTRFANACYPEHGLPLLLYLMRRNGAGLESSLLANANAGGDNVHRGMILGLLVGAATESVPDHLRQGLADHEAIGREIAAFCEVAAQGGV